MGSKGRGHGPAWWNSDSWPRDRSESKARNSENKMEHGPIESHASCSLMQPEVLQESLPRSWFMRTEGVRH